MIRTKVLSNNLTLITSNISSSTISIVISVNTGSVNDTIPGISHFLEHMVFSGNKKYSKEKIKEIFGKYCVKYNAATTLFETKFYIQVASNYFLDVIDVFLNMLFYPAFTTNNIVCERGVIHEEIDRYKDIYSDLVKTKTREKVFLDTVASNSILGSHKSIENIDLYALNFYYKKYYVSNNITVAVVGNIGKYDIENLLSNVNIRQGKLAKKLSINANFKPEIFREKIGINQAHICTMQKGISYNQNMYYAYLIFSALFGGISGNFLNKYLRDRKGMIYTGYAYTESYNDTEIFVVYIACKKENINDTIELIYSAFSDMPESITSELVENVKLSYMISIELSRDKPLSLAESYISDHRIYGRVLKDKEILTNIQDVKYEDVVNVAKYFSSNCKNSITTILY